jgi:hypothetical protein
MKMIEDYESINKMTDAQAAEVLENMIIRIYGGRSNGKTRLFYSYNVAMQKAIQKLKDGWIPIKMRPGTDEEYEEFSLYGDCPREDFRVFDCPLPDDDQEVLVTTRWGDVCIDTWHRDVDCCYFEDNCDDDDVIAWMPIPAAYKSEV